MDFSKIIEYTAQTRAGVNRNPQTMMMTCAIMSPALPHQAKRLARGKQAAVRNIGNRLIVPSGAALKFLDVKPSITSEP